MTIYIYNSRKNANIKYISLKFNYKYHPHVFYKNNIIFSIKFKLANKKFVKLENFITI